MFAIEVEYLLGRAVATSHVSRSEPEWPPHPQRLFAALVDAHYAEPSPEGRAALEWLESLPPPRIDVDSYDQAAVRATKHFVPVNDELPSANKLLAARPLPEQRLRQERWFPAYVPDEPRVLFAWDAADADPHRDALARLAERLCFLGHSSSLIRAFVPPAHAVPTPSLRSLIPLPEPERGEARLRIPGPGRFRHLDEVHEVRSHQESRQPDPGIDRGYGRALKSERSGPLSPVGVLEIVGGPRIALDATVPATSRLREAWLSVLDGALPETLSGHAPDGSRARTAHAAFVPLAHVGNPHADGAIKGFALMLPKDMDARWRARASEAFLDIAELRLGGLGLLELSPHDEPGLTSLQMGRLVGPSQVWQTVTPLVLGRHPKPRKGLDEVEIVRLDVQSAGLPEPVEIRLGPVSPILGGPPARDCALRGASHLEGRLRRHAVIRFPEPIAGPCLVGAGRFFGLGLLMPREDTR